MNVFFVRHGQSAGNVDNSVYGTIPDSEVPLTKTGIRQAEEAGEYFREVFGDTEVQIITSPYLRARKTTDIIASKLYKVFVDETPLIREREWGSLRDNILKVDKVEREHLFDFYYRPDYGESFADAYNRAVIFIETILPKYKNKNVNDNVIVVSHGEFIKVALMYVDRLPVRMFPDINNIKNCELKFRTIY